MPPAQKRYETGTKPQGGETNQLHKGSFDEEFD